MKRDATTSLLLTDPWFIAILDRVIAKYGRRWTPEQIQAFRRQVAFTMETHPKARALLAAERPGLHLRLSKSKSD